MKDIFIDNSIACRFCNPLDPEYKKLIAWLMKFDEADPENNAMIVVSKKLIGEYLSSSRSSASGSSIPVIINLMYAQGRRLLVSNKDIKDFRNIFFKKKVVKSLRCNKKDWDHIPVVILSNRKYALSMDDNFVYDLLNFPGFKVFAKKRPEELPYSV